MKKIKLFLVFAFLLTYSVLLSGCTDKSEKATNTSSTQKTYKFTIDDIKKKYTDAKIKNIQNVGKDLVLIESKRDTCANFFDLYNLKTGEINNLPTMAEFVTLEKVENENYFVFLSSGKNSESPFSKFPYLIRCIRINNNINKNDNFIALQEDKYFSLDYLVQLGCKEEEIMSNLNVNFDGLEVSFEPIKGKESQFYADASDIPPTKITYNKDKNQIILEINAHELNEKLKGMKNVKLDNNQYMSSYDITEKDNKIYLTITLRDVAKTYMVKLKRLPNGFPYFSIMFAKE